MSRRPPVKRGDICKGHKKRNQGDYLWRNSTFVVLGVDGEPTEGYSVVEVNQHVQLPSGKWYVTPRHVQRRDLWLTGANVFERLPDKKIKGNLNIGELIKQMVLDIPTHNPPRYFVVDTVPQSDLRESEAEVKSAPISDMANDSKGKDALKKWLGEN